LSHGHRHALLAFPGQQQERSLTMTRRYLIPMAMALIGLPAMPSSANDTGFAQTTHATRREGGKLCVLGHTHGGSASAGTKSVALIAAIKIFVITTTDEYGSDWANWAKAGSKRISYAQTADGWSASIEGRPCK
jgi:hypothetical protein